MHKNNHAGNLRSIINSLIHNNAPKEQKVDDDFFDLIHRSEIKKIENILDKKIVGPNILDKKKQTPLIVAAKNGNKELTKLLLKHKACPHYTDIKGRSALWFAINENTIDIALPISRYLLINNAAPCMNSIDKLSPFYLSLMLNSIELTNELAKHGELYETTKKILLSKFPNNEFLKRDIPRHSLELEIPMNENSINCFENFSSEERSSPVELVGEPDIASSTSSSFSEDYLLPSPTDLSSSQEFEKI